jgi:hypothetical protein
LQEEISPFGRSDTLAYGVISTGGRDLELPPLFEKLCPLWFRFSEDLDSDNRQRTFDFVLILGYNAADGVFFW